MTESISLSRSRNYLKQLQGSIILKAMTIVASFLAIPIMIGYLGKEQFGVWSTLLSVISWIVLFDLGLGNGLRNKLTESLARNDTSTAGQLISSCYSLIGILAVAIFLLLATISHFVPWQVVFNTKQIDESELRHTVLIAAIGILSTFWIGLINQVLNAVQQTAMVNFSQFLTNALILVLVFLLSKTTNASLVYLATAYTAALISTNLAMNFFFYKKNMRLKPHLTFDFVKIKPLLTLGIQFFIIQTAVLVIFLTDKILITQFFGPEQVTQYDIAFKLFGIITLTHGLIMAPLWSAYTDAYHRHDTVWISNTIKSQIKIFFVLVVAITVISLLAQPIIKLWIGQSVTVDPMLLASMGVFCALSTWSNVFATCVNGIGKIKPQLYSSVLAMLTNIPVAIVLVKYFNVGTYGIVLSTCVSLLYFSIIGPVQVITELKTLKNANPT